MQYMFPEIKKKNKFNSFESLKKLIQTKLYKNISRWNHKNSRIPCEFGHTPSLHPARPSVEGLQMRKKKIILLYC